MAGQDNPMDSFATRLGFILVSAGCAIGIGNVWKFPYLCGQFGGAAFILIYLIFLLIMGIPVMVCEFAIGRGSRRSAAKSFDVLEPPGTRWHKFKWISIIGCYMLMMYYTTVTGWMLYYCYLHFRGAFIGATPKVIGAAFGAMLGSASTMMFWMVLACVIGFLVCYFGIQNGVERITKVMMVALLLLMVALAIHSVFLEGAEKGIEFYLVPNFDAINKIGWGNVIFAAMSQAFFTLSIGIGAMLIFGAYLPRGRSLLGEAVTITALDTFVALMAGFIIIPACFAYGIKPDAGPSLIFLTIPNLFAQMPGGQIWGMLFFVFLSFAALSTVIAVFENLIAFGMNLFGWQRKESVMINGILVVILSVPCVLGFNIWSGFQPLGPGTGILDLEDFIVSNNLLPLGSLVFVLFCTKKNGWTWENFLAEANDGLGTKMPAGVKNYLMYILPLFILTIYLKGYYDMFVKQGTGALIKWFCIAACFLLYILYGSMGTVKSKK
ncbi:MAG: sodium-dependent transporter [Acidaminococcus sp.]|jgi:NSS family neurotransmitter:Na+ symporter|nr:sodium-dependent transporter [Acidaminococcus sp.]